MQRTSQPPAASALAAQALLEKIPGTIPLPGAKTVRQVLAEELPKAKLSREGDGPITGLGPEEWNQILRRLKRRGRSPQTRYRYRKILRLIAEAWLAAMRSGELEANSAGSDPDIDALISDAQPAED